METELKPIAEKRYHRIIVNVTDAEIADNKLGSNMLTMLRPAKSGSKIGLSSSARIPSKNVSADVDVLNCTTLSLTQKNAQNHGIRTNQIMYFDCVGRTESDPLVRYELGSMFDLLMIDRRNCCLVNFKPLRETPTNFFNSILVPEVDKRLMMLQGTMSLNHIKLEYFDVQKYDVVNMCEISKRTKKTEGSELIFRNTRGLLRWTQRSYPNLWVHGSEHDCFDLEFVFNEPSDNDHNSFGTKIKVKLSILQFYLNKMDGDMRVGLRNFLENVNQTDLRMKHSILTDYLREYFFNEKDSWQIWMLFDVPTVNYGSSLANDMLTLAQAAYTGVHDTNMLINNSDYDILYTPPNDKSYTQRQVSGSSVTASSTSSLVKQKIKTKKLGSMDTKIANYSLSFWYRRIDESYINVITTLERYYDRKYDLKVQKMCGDLKRLTRSIDNQTIRPSQATLDDSDIEADGQLQTFFKQYKEALTEFRVLVQRVERIKYADQLNVFIHSKNDDIAKQTRQMKVRLLELCQARISSAIRDEVNTLTSERDLSSRFVHSAGNTSKLI